jgi:hypothetical protein
MKNALLRKVVIFVVGTGRPYKAQQKIVCFQMVCSITVSIGGVVVKRPVINLVILGSIPSLVSVSNILKRHEL